ncbi:hypothetical protein PAI11_21840 [Patulibacter medicamentivorans]|jgi:hypothetical protein|uniref:Uncharacterized protein n=1 Tax=Patulibacter medicamentivorans TaxID=1097667 RepID=H0E5T5_9ACTN|nr:hypothetical protein [Patulibacter medicamentivorans]EHN10955.1 hypothetical protein PAI11_21840 [Patulibacter medicamentivorans]
MSTHPSHGHRDGRWRPIVVHGRHDGRPPLDVRVRAMLERRDRMRLADGLELMIVHAQRPEGILSARIPVVPSQVLDAREVLEDIERVLRSDVQIDPRGTALVRALLVDGAGPAYVGGRRGALHEAALEARNALIPYRWAG